MGKQWLIYVNCEILIHLLITLLSAAIMADGYEVPKFQVWDYVVFSCLLAISAGIGVYHACAGGKQSTTKEFLLADKKMNVAPVAMSMLASFMSAITLMGNPAEIYNYGTQFFVIGLSYALVIPAAAHLYIPIFYNLNLTSAYEVSVSRI